MILSCLTHVKRNGNSEKRPNVPQVAQKSTPTSATAGTFQSEQPNLPLSMNDVHNFLTMTYREILSNWPKTEALLGVSAEELATATAEQGFIDAGIRFGGCMTWNDWKLLLDTNDIFHTNGYIKIGGKSRAPISSVIYESEYPLWDANQSDDQGRLCGGKYRVFRHGMSREEYYDENSQNTWSVQAEDEDSSDFDDLELGELSDDSYYEPSTPPRGTTAEKTGPPDIRREYQDAKKSRKGVGRFVLLDPRDNEMDSSDDTTEVEESSEELNEPLKDQWESDVDQFYRDQRDLCDIMC